MQYLLYRVVYPKRSKTKKEDNTPHKRETDISDVVVRTRFVRPVSGQVPNTDTVSLSSEFREEKPNVPAAENEKKNAVVPSEKIDSLFMVEPDPKDLDIPPDDDEEDENVERDLEEEAEDLRQSPDGDAGVAAGLTIEEMAEAIEAICNPTDEKASILYRVEKTDMFEQLVSGVEGKAERINDIVERYLKNLYLPQVEKPEESDEKINGNDEWEKFDVRSIVE